MDETISVLAGIGAGTVFALCLAGLLSIQEDMSEKCIVNTHQTPEQYQGGGEYHGVYKGDLLVLQPCQ